MHHADTRAFPWRQHLEGMVGNVGFDPMGLSTPQNIKWMREAELKHGRMSMLAWTVRRFPSALLLAEAVSWGRLQTPLPFTLHRVMSWSTLA